MSLKKTDKIIAIIGVLILIIAGIGIFMYVGTEETTSNEPTEGTIYEVTWEEKTDTLPATQGYAGKKADYTDPISVSATQSGSVITKVDIRISWKDDKTSGIFFRKGLIKRGIDTLTAEITPQVGDALKLTSKGAGNDTMSFDVNSAPQPEEITDVSSIGDAEQMIKEKYANKDTASFTTKIKVTPGEKFGIRPLKLLRFFMDKGNTFDIEVSYTYYVPIVQEGSIENNQPDQPDNDGQTGFGPASRGEI